MMSTQMVTVEDLWVLLSLNENALESTNLVELNLAVAKEIPSLKELDIARYCRIVDEWTDAFRKGQKRGRGSFFDFD